MSCQRPGVDGLVCSAAAWCSNSKVAQRLCLSAINITTDGCGSLQLCWLTVQIKIQSSAFSIYLLSLPLLLFILSDQVKLISRSVLSYSSGAEHAITPPLPSRGHTPNVWALLCKTGCTYIQTWCDWLWTAAASSSLPSKSGCLSGSCPASSNHSPSSSRHLGHSYLHASPQQSRFIPQE